MNMEQLKEFVALEKRKRDLDSELKAIAARIDDLEQALVPQFLNDGINSLRIDGRQVYLAQEIYAGPLRDRADNTQSLKAFVREVAEEARLRCEQAERLFTEDEVRAALPAPLSGALKISFVHSLRSRKA